MEGNQNLPAIGGQGVGVECQRHGHLLASETAKYICCILVHKQNFPFWLTFFALRQPFSIYVFLPQDANAREGFSQLGSGPIN